MAKYLGITPTVGYNLDEELDPLEWDVYKTQGVPPKGMSRRKKIIDWRAPEIQVAIRKSDNTPVALPYIAALFYVADYFPRQISPDLVNLPEGWIAPMGYMLFSENNNRGKIEEAVRKHLSSLDDYADSMVIDNMAAIGLEIKDIYDFFAIITEKFSLWVSNNQDKVNSMYDKELSVLYFVLFDVTKAIFNLFFALHPRFPYPLYIITSKSTRTILPSVRSVKELPEHYFKKVKRPNNKELQLLNKLSLKVDKIKNLELYKISQDLKDSSDAQKKLYVETKELYFLETLNHLLLEKPKTKTGKKSRMTETIQPIPEPEANGENSEKK
jgi:hypothetical protein